MFIKVDHRKANEFTYVPFGDDKCMCVCVCVYIYMFVCVYPLWCAVEKYFPMKLILFSTYID